MMIEGLRVRMRERMGVRMRMREMVGMGMVSVVESRIRVHGMHDLGLSVGSGSVHSWSFGEEE